VRRLFLAMSAAAYGEATLARRLAWELHARGDEVIVLGASALHPIWQGTPFRFGAIDAIARVVHDALPGVIAKRQCDSLVLVDLTSTIVACRLYGVDPRFVHALGVPVSALDAWNLPETTRRWDVGGRTLDLSGLDVAARMVAVPFVRPDARGAYCALPAPAPRTLAARPQILVTTAAWQTAPAGDHSAHYTIVPERLVAELASIDADIVHVGPAPLAAASSLGDRYRWRGRVSPDDMIACVAQSDVLVTLNLAATTISTALACGVPVVAGINSQPTADVPRFLVWPLGLADFLAPVIDGNPYRDVVGVAEILEEGALADACRSRMRDAATEARIADYVARVRRLPSGAEVLSSLS
jgi:hypothetical protein